MGDMRILACLISSLMIAAPSLACSCLPAETAGQQAARADLVFIGRVIHTGPVGDDRPWWRRLVDRDSAPPPPAHRRQITTFQVDRLLKGDGDPGNVAISHLPGLRSEDCGLDFHGRAPQVILAFRRAQGGYATSTCHRARFPEAVFRDALEPDAR
jgi:hypothetical protein